MLELAAVLSSQRATDVAPSVALVALLECSLPVFVMIFSWLLLRTQHRWRARNDDEVRSTLAMQTRAYPAKLVSLALIVSAVSLVHF